MEGTGSKQTSATVKIYTDAAHVFKHNILLLLLKLLPNN